MVHTRTFKLNDQIPAWDTSVAGKHCALKFYHGQASKVLHRHVELAQIQLFFAHDRKVRNWRPPILHKGQVAIHPALSLCLASHFVQPGNLVICCGSRARFLKVWDRDRELMWLQN